MIRASLTFSEICYHYNSLKEVQLLLR